MNDDLIAKKQLMKAQVEWIEALRSGKYKRSTGCLRVQTKDYMGYCCLGVLCDIQPGAKWVPAPNKDAFQFMNEMGSTMTASEELLKSVDLHDSSRLSSDSSWVMSANDSRPNSDTSYERVIPTILDIWEQRGYDVQALRV